MFIFLILRFPKAIALLTRDGVGPRFTPLTIATPHVPEVFNGPSVPTQTQTVDITLPSGRRLSVAATIDPVMLARLVQALDPS